MKVAQIVPAIDRGGAERVVTLLAADLVRRGHEVDVVCFSEPSAPVREAWLDEGGSRLIVVPKRPGFDPTLLVRLSVLLGRHRYDVVHTHLGALRYVTPFYATIRPNAVVHTVHNEPSREMTGVGVRVHRYAFRRGARGVVLGTAFGSRFQAIYGCPPAAVIPNGIPDEWCRIDEVSWASRREATRRALRVAPGEALVTCVAGLRPQKQLHILIESLAHVLRQRAFVRLAIVGEGTERDVLIRLIQNLGVGANVELLGARGDVPDLLCASDVFAMSSGYEGHPIALLEALGMGLPIVATQVGCIPETVEGLSAAYLVESGDVSALANAIIAAVDAPRGRRTDASTRVQERYSVSAMGARYESLYHEMLG